MGVRPALLPSWLPGRRRLDSRKVINRIVWKFRTGSAWREVPGRYGPWATLHTRFRRWAADGTFERMLRAAQATAPRRATSMGWCLSRCAGVRRAGHRPSGNMSVSGCGHMLSGPCASPCEPRDAVLPQRSHRWKRSWNCSSARKMRGSSVVMA
ncbi:transposase [Streptomyces atroolivaceus]|uniref:transposase n=1 Tax=Streptomyces atroolivaceus TaxID=66869 RepID=UPI0012FED5B2